MSENPMIYRGEDDDAFRILQKDSHDLLCVELDRSEPETIDYFKVSVTTAIHDSLYTNEYTNVVFLIKTDSEYILYIDKTGVPCLRELRINRRFIVSIDGYKIPFRE